MDNFKLTWRLDLLGVLIDCHNGHDLSLLLTLAASVFLVFSILALNLNVIQGHINASITDCVLIIIIIMAHVACILQFVLCDQLSDLYLNNIPVDFMQLDL